jgi:hypothetical protein
MDSAIKVEVTTAMVQGTNEIRMFLLWEGGGGGHRLSNTTLGSSCPAGSWEGIGVPKRHLLLWMQSRKVDLKKENAP